MNPGSAPNPGWVQESDRAGAGTARPRKTPCYVVLTRRGDEAVPAPFLNAPWLQISKNRQGFAHRTRQKRRGSVLECGGAPSATPLLWPVGRGAGTRKRQSTGAVQDAIASPKVCPRAQCRVGQAAA